MLLHVVFWTKHREPWITPAVAERLYPYIGGVNRAEKDRLYEIGGIEGHIHLYLRWRPGGLVCDLMRTVKARSSKWLHDEFPALGSFAWQEAYSLFTVSKPQQAAVKKYIAGQRERHKTEDCKVELLRLLKLHEIVFHGLRLPAKPGCASPMAATLRAFGAGKQSVEHTGRNRSASGPVAVIVNR